MTQTQPQPHTPAEPVTSVLAVQRILDRIRDHAERGNYRFAVTLERTLWEGVLEAIAGCNAQAGYLAAEALKSHEIDFPRWAV